MRVLPGARFDKYRTDPYLSTPIVSYMLGLGEDDAATIEAALDIAQPKIGGKTMVMTAADKFRAEGIEQGRRQGLEQGKQMRAATAERFRAEGIAEGMEQGKAQGMTQGKAETLLSLLRLKFGKLPASAQKQVRAAGAKQLDAWIAAVLTASTLDAALAAKPAQG